jgi:hypothetical protein
MKNNQATKIKLCWTHNLHKRKVLCKEEESVLDNSLNFYKEFKNQKCYESTAQNQKHQPKSSQKLNK